MQYDFDQRSLDTALCFDGTENLCRPEFASQCNINNIVKKYIRNGNNPFVVTQDAKYGDFTNIPNYQDALQLVIAAEEHFEALPPEVRRRFDNDPAQMIAFLDDSSNREEAIKLGLVQDLTNFEKNFPPSADSSSSEGAGNP